MSLTPTNLFNLGSSAIPSLFLEARIHGGNGPTDEIISQLGLSLTSNQVDIALFTRTSGIVLITTFGSYIAYRVCAKYLGKEFVWTLIDATRLDCLSRADSRLLHPAAEGYLTSRQSSTFYEERARKRLCQLLRSLSEDDKAASAVGLSVLANSDRQSVADSACQQKQRYRLLSTRSGSPVRVICASNQLLRRSLQRPDQKESGSGLGGIRQWNLDEASTENRTVSTRKHVPLVAEDCDALSDITSVSRIQPPPDALLKTNCCADDLDGYLDEEDANSDSSSCRRSMFAESLSWNDEFHGDNASVTNPMFSYGSSSNISEMSAMKNLEGMWARNPGKVDSSATSLILRLDDNQDDTSSCCGGTQNLAALIESKCSAQSCSYMYQSVHVDLDDGGSQVNGDEEDNQSVLSANFTAKLVKESHGLWEISSPLEKNAAETVRLQPHSSTSRLMTESSSSSKSQRKSAMFDSAIGTDLLSSDDDKSSLHGHATKRVDESITARHSSWLDRIVEKESPMHRPRLSSVVSSVAPSHKSLEWFDELPANASSESRVETDKGTPL